jgi:hypothetical protein
MFISVVLQETLATVQETLDFRESQIQELEVAIADLQKQKQDLQIQIQVHMAVQIQESFSYKFLSNVIRICVLQWHDVIF